MSTIEPDDVVEANPDRPAGRWLASALTIALLLAAALAVYLEPYSLLDRVREALREGDEARQRALVDPDLLAPGLATLLEASRPGPGRIVEKRYETVSRFLVSVRPEGPAVAADSSEVLTFVLERRGLSWWLADVHGPEPLAIGGQPAPPPGGAPGDSLPAFGSYVYVDELPQVVERPAPLYPEAARRAGIQGTVLVQALVGRDGLVKEARVQEGEPLLRAAALEAVRRWRFEPAKSGGRPTAVWVTTPVKFTLH